MTDSPSWTWTPPTPSRVEANSREHGLGLDPRTAEAAVDFGAAVGDLYERVGRWWQEEAARTEPAHVPRKPGDDPWNAAQYRVQVPATGSGALDGLSLAVKDSIRVGGVPLVYGSRMLEGPAARTSATVVTRALAAGGSITHIGRSDDLGLAITGDQNHAGPVLNPWNTGHTPWGSSSGTAALVAAGEVDAAIMVDQAGSGRVPSAGCGLAALMPTRGVIPMTGVLGLTGVQDRVVAASRRVVTVAAVASVLSGGDGHDLRSGPELATRDWTFGLDGDVAGMRVGIVTESLAPEVTDPAVADAVLARARELAALGAQVREVSVPRYADASALAMILTVHRGIPDLLATGLGSSAVLGGDPLLAEHVAAVRAEDPAALAPTVRVSTGAAAHEGGQAPGVWLAAAMDLIPRLAAQFTRHFAGVASGSEPGSDGVDVLLTPTVPSVPPVLPDGMAMVEELGRAMGPGITHACAHNLTGLPAGQAPAGLVDGLPVGVQIIAPPLMEAQILRVLAALEPAGGFPAAPRG
ncbi:amidase family protein [Streptomyces sp. XM4193]|uniref:amidase family protein n=1 Tax=Streptomyces sp. XM4193 TaxID=2929782 RepID=UPI001FFAEC64|nr:amidase family protein [Streptomyces sp. XM4193]MCK1796658.1 amidase family protein [Streptomyces sp. XM4193]